ncbi:MAG: Maff2 family mobile element protein [Lachnospiraceae bacterium]
MEFLQLIIDYASLIVTLFGGGIAISGIIKLSEGKSQQNSGAQDEGMSKIVGGGGIILVGTLLVPQIMNFFKA